MSKDQTIGALILVVCVVVAVGYLAGLFLYEPLVKPWLNIGAASNVQFWLIATPVFIGFVAILAIGAWIGYTMATTPSPKPIEEITTDANTETETKTAKK